MKTLVTSYSSMDDVVFENRNTSYGAYALRKDFHKHVSFGALIALGSFALSMGVPEFIKTLNGPVEVAQILHKLDSSIILDPPPIVEVPPPPVVKLPPPQVNSVRFLPPSVTSAPVNEEEMPTIKEVKAHVVIGSVTNDVIIASEPTFQDNLPDVTFTGNGEVKPEIFIKVEQMPEFKNLSSFLQTNLKYPDVAVQNEIQGAVYMSFIVDTDGTITDVTVLRGISKECDEEALRVVKKMPKWSPGKQSGKAVKVRFSLPIVFRLN